MSRRTDAFFEVLDLSVPVFDDYDQSRFDDASMRYASSRVLRYVTDGFIKACRQDSENLERFFKALKDMSTEEARTLLYSKNSMNGSSFDNLNFDDDDYKNNLILYFKSHDEPLLEFNKIISYKISSFLPESYLDWFKDNLRYSLFLAYLMKEGIYHSAYQGKDELINAVIYVLRYQTDEFIELWEKSLPNYEHQADSFGDFQVKHILKAKAIYFKNQLDLSRDAKWVDATNVEQIEWIYQYLRNKEPQQIILDKVFIPKNNEEKYELVLASLDILSNVKDADIGTKKNKGFSERGYTLYSMKKAWDGQKNYSQKKQIDSGNVKIYKKNQDKLEALMTFSNFTANQIVNNSIEQMYAQLIEGNEQNGDNA